MTHYHLRDLNRLLACNGHRHIYTSSHDDADSRVSDALASMIRAHVARCDDYDPGIDSQIVKDLDSTATLIGTRGCNDVRVNSKCDFTVSSEHDIAINGSMNAISVDASQRIMYVDRMEYGHRLVEVRDNWDLITASIGALIRNGDSDVDSVVLSIHQPRAMHRDGVHRSITVDKCDLLGDYRARLTDALTCLNDELTPGGHCHGCGAASECTSLRNDARHYVNTSTVHQRDVLSCDELANELDELTRALDIIKIRHRALESETVARISNGHTIPGYGMTESVGRATWMDGLDAEALSLMTGISVDDLTKRSLLAPSAVKKLGADADLISSLTEAPRRGLKLTRLDIDNEARRIFS